MMVSGRKNDLPWFRTHPLLEALGLDDVPGKPGDEEPLCLGLALHRFNHHVEDDALLKQMVTL